MTPFGESLEKFRRDKNLKQIELARLVGIEPSYVSLMERGYKGPPSADVLKRIAVALKLKNHEVQKLQRDAEISESNFKIPLSTSRAEFELLHRLKVHLGSLNEKQVLIMNTVLDMGNYNEYEGETIMKT
jgi:transcriptional regulator with XRE-family HTH domain